MNAARLLPEPPDGFKVVVPPRPVNLLRRAFNRVMAGYTDGAYVLWAAESNTSPVKLLRAIIWLYETPTSH